MNELYKLVENFSNYTCFFFFLIISLVTKDQGRRRSLDFLGIKTSPCMV
jgi:hypothetical protein